MTTRGIFTLVLLTTACSSTTATYAERDSEESLGGATSASSAPGAKALGAVSSASTGGAAQAAGGSDPGIANSAPDTSVGGASSGSTTLVLGSQGGVQARFSFPEQLPASGGSEAAGGTEASGGSSARMAALPVAAGTSSSVESGGFAGVAGSAGAAGLPQYYSEIDNQVHPITDAPESVYDYDKFVNINCSEVIRRPYDLCEPVDTSAQVGEWRWRAKRVPSNQLITATLAAGDAACGKINMASVCGSAVRDDGTCGPDARTTVECAKVDVRSAINCWRVALSCTEIPGVTAPLNGCKSAKDLANLDGTCPSY
jgi:hypothetical protein